MGIYIYTNEETGTMNLASRAERRQGGAVLVANGDSHLKHNCKMQERLEKDAEN